MKKVWTLIAATFVAIGMQAQNNMTIATQKANAAKEFLGSGDYSLAISGFKEALSLAEASGDEGLSLAAACKSILPRAMRNLARKELNSKNFDGAINALKDVAEFCGSYGDLTAAADAKALITKILTQKAGSLLDAKQYEKAAEACKAALVDDPKNGLASLRLGMALEGMDNYWGAVDAYTAASENGQAANAAKKLGRCYLLRAYDNLKANDFNAAVKDALASNEYIPSPQAIQIAGNASMMSGNRADAIKYYEKYLADAPAADNAAQVAYVLGALYQENGDNAKALEFLNKALSDPKYGADAKKAIDALNKAAKSTKKRR